MEPRIIKKIKQIVTMGLDVINQTICTMDIIKRMEAIGNKAGKLFGDMLRFTLKTQHDEFGLDAGPIHDATTIGYLINPDLFKVKPMHVEMCLDHRLCYRRTVCDENHVLNKPENVDVGLGIDHDGFFDLVEQCLKMYD